MEGKKEEGKEAGAPPKKAPSVEKAKKKLEDSVTTARLYVQGKKAPSEEKTKKKSEDSVTTAQLYATETKAEESVSTPTKSLTATRGTETKTKEATVSPSKGSYTTRGTTTEPSGEAKTEESSMQATTAKSYVTRGTKTSSSSSSGEVFGQRLILVRHGERVDRIFPDWLRLAFRGGGGRGGGKWTYRPYDLNLPLALPARPSLHHFYNDAPITELGAASAQLLGRGLGRAGITPAPTRLYVSPSLRCLQTGAQLARSLHNLPPMRVEPGLLEWLGWYPQLPALFTPDEAAKTFNVDVDYRPNLSLADLAQLHSKGESVAAYEKRTQRVLGQLAAAEEGSVIVVAHAPTIDIAARSFTAPPGNRFPAMDGADLEVVGQHYPYGSSLILARRNRPGEKEAEWAIDPVSLPAFTYARFSNRPNHAFTVRT